MELYAKSECARLAKGELEKRRRLRIVQVRKQTTDWMAKTRKNYEHEKSRQLRQIIEEKTTEREAQAMAEIQNIIETHEVGMKGIGEAHRAAELEIQRQLEMEKMKEEDKIRRDKLAAKRHIKAMKVKRANVAYSQHDIVNSRRLKEEVRKDEDIIAKNLVITKPYVPAVRTSASTGIGVEKRLPRFPPSPTKYLQVPSEAKEGSRPSRKKKTKVRSKSEPAKPKEKSSVQKPVPSTDRTDNVPKTGRSSIFEIIATEREGGASTPVVKELVTKLTGESLSPKSKKIHELPKMKDARRSGSDVTYFDASLPLPCIRYKAPSGLAKREHSEVSKSSSAWTEAARLNEWQQKSRETSIAKERERRTQERGRKALRLARLDQRYKQLESDLLVDHFQGIQPVFDTPKRDSLLGLDDIEPPSLNSSILTDKPVDERVEFIEPLPLPSRTQVQGGRLSRAESFRSESSGSTQFVSLHDGETSEGSEDETDAAVQLLEVKQNNRILALPKPKAKSPALDEEQKKNLKKIEIGTGKEVQVPGHFHISQQQSNSSSPGSSSLTFLSTARRSFSSESHSLSSSNFESINTSSSSSIKTLEFSSVTISDNQPLNSFSLSSPSSSSEEHSAAMKFSIRQVDETGDHLENLDSIMVATTSGLHSSTPRKGKALSSARMHDQVLVKHYLKQLLNRRHLSLESVPTNSDSTNSSSPNSQLAIISQTSSSTSSAGLSSHVVARINSEDSSSSRIEDVSLSATMTTTTTTSSDSTLADVNIKISPEKKSPPQIMEATTDSSLSDALHSLCVNQQGQVHHRAQEEPKEQKKGQRRKSNDNKSSSSTSWLTKSTSTSSMSTSSILSHAKKLLNPDQENMKQIFKLPSTSGESEDNSMSTKSGRKSGEVWRRSFGVNLENIQQSPAQSSEQPTTELPSLKNSSAFRKLTYDWANVTIDKPAWL